MLIMCYNPLKREMLNKNERKKITLSDLPYIRSSNDCLHERGRQNSGTDTSCL